MNAVMIDPVNMKITDVVYDGNWRTISEHIEAEHFDLVRVNNLADALYVDDEGLYREGQSFFVYDGYEQPLAGKGLLVGTSKRGDSIDSTVTAEEVRKKVQWALPVVRRGETRVSLALYRADQIEEAEFEEL